MSLLIQAFILERFGLRLNTDQIAELLGISKPALYNQISAGTLRLKTYVDGGKRYADYCDAAAYFDEARERAARDAAYIEGKHRRALPAIAAGTNHSSRYVRIPLASDMTGYSVEAIETKIKRGVWLEGKEYIRAPDKSVLIDMEGYERWATGQRTST